MRAFKYFVKEAALSLWRRQRTAWLAVATIASAMFVLGGFLLVTSNLERLLARWNESAEFSIYLRDDVTAADRAALDRVLTESGVAASREFVSKDQAIVRFKRDFPDLADAASDLNTNPLPASIEVRVNASDTAAEALSRLAGQVRGMSGVADVRYDRRWIERLVTAVGLVRGVGVFLAGILVIAASLTVASVVRLALYARRDEIEIMELVGAPISYIRGPFVLEGVLQGGAGALASILVLWILYLSGRARYESLASGLIDPSMISFLPIQLCLLLFIGGMAVGCIGGFVAAKSVT
jgi:cell division transport system permease protein